ncbi:hypothetical protein [Lysinibacillus fusiformis]|uniref:hypothetical protein n=2 Tax=Lysinibacillus fusiformis TaxID=28031 RepID=UPI003719219F
MLFSQTIDVMAGFNSVQLYNKIQKIKGLIINDIANGNGTKDFTYISQDLKKIYEEISIIYKSLVTFDLTDPEKYYEESNEVMNKLMRLYSDEIISIKKTNVDYQNELKTSNYYIYKTITWRTGELFREVEVVRYKDKTRGITPIVVNKFNESTKNNLDEKRKKHTSLYVGPMDIGFYPFYSPKYFLKNSFIMHELIKIERTIHRRILFELDFIIANQYGKYDYFNNEFTWLETTTPEELEQNIKDYYINVYQKRYGKYFNPDYNNALDLLQESWKVWKKRHNLFLDYFMAIQFLEEDLELNEQLESVKEYTNQNLNVPEDIRFKLDFLNEEKESHFENKNELKEFYIDIRNQFYNNYTKINKEIKSLHKELAKIK